MPKRGLCSNQTVVVHGQSLLFSDACALYGVDVKYVRLRMKGGLPLQEALALPKRAPVRQLVVSAERGVLHPMMHVLGKTGAGIKVQCSRCHATSVRANRLLHRACQGCRRHVEYKGRWWSIKELAEAHNANPTTVNGRLRRGLSVADALMPPGVRLGAELISVSELGRRAGISPTSAKTRIDRGETPEAIVAAGRLIRRACVAGDVRHGLRVLAVAPGQRYKVSCTVCKTEKFIRVSDFRPGCAACTSYKRSLKLELHGKLLTLREASHLFGVSPISVRARAKAFKLSLVDALLTLRRPPGTRA